MQPQHDGGTLMVMVEHQPAEVLLPTANLATGLDVITGRHRGPWRQQPDPSEWQAA